MADTTTPERSSDAEKSTTKPLDFYARRFLAVVHERDTLAEQIANVEAVIAHARKISPSPSMTVYVADLERALGRDAATPHKLGQEATA